MEAGKGVLRSEASPGFPPLTTTLEHFNLERGSMVQEVERAALRQSFKYQTYGKSASWISIRVESVVLP